MHHNADKKIPAVLVLIVVGFIGFVVLFYQLLGPAIIDRVIAGPPASQKDMSVKELEQTLSRYIELYESNMFLYKEYRNTVLGDIKVDAEQYRRNAASASKLYEEAYASNRELAKALPIDVFPEKLE